MKSEVGEEMGQPRNGSGSYRTAWNFGMILLGVLVTQNLPHNGVSLLIAIPIGIVVAASGYTLARIISSWTRVGSESELEDYLKPKVNTQKFETRLANFVGREEDELLPENEIQESRMTFWMRLERLIYSAPKSAETIRKYLLAIRQRVRG